MKRKLSLFVNIATLVLCVSAIAIGVYSAKTASLNVSGTVGFTAHNCEIELNGSIVACEDSNATATKEVIIPQTFIGRGDVPSAYSLNLNKTFSGDENGKMYFSDMFEGGKIITITLKVKNQSKYDVVANVSSPTFANSACTMSVKLNNTDLAEAGTSIELTKDGATESVMVITITLNDDSSDIQSASISGKLFEFEKKTPVKLINFTIDGISYQAEESMTWGEWVNSKYCSNSSCVVDGNSIIHIYGHGIVYFDYLLGIAVAPTDFIIGSHAYNSGSGSTAN